MPYHRQSQVMARQLGAITEVTLSTTLTLGRKTPMLRKVNGMTCPRLERELGPEPGLLILTRDPLHLPNQTKPNHPRC